MKYRERLRFSDLIPGLDVSYPRYTGMWDLINTYRTTGRISLLYKIQCFITGVLFTPYLIFQIICPFFIRVDLEKATLLILIIVSCVQAFVKPAIFWNNIDAQSQLFEVMTKDLLTSIPHYKRDQAGRIYAKVVKRCNLFSYTALGLCFTTVFLWTVFPGISSEYIAHHVGNMKEVTTGPKKPLGAWYPVPFWTPPWSDVVYYFEIVFFAWLAMMVSIHELMTTQQIMALHAHQSALGYHISTLRKDEIVFYSGKQGLTPEQADELLYQELLAIVKDHQNLLRYGRMLKENYNAYTTILLANGVTILIITIFQFVFGAKDILMSIKFVLYLSYEATEFIFLCLATTMLETSSTNIKFFTYSSDWYTSKKRIRDTSRMVMVRSQKPVSLIAVKMYPVNVETLMAIFQFAYTVSALLSRMLE